jgi:hypothetical protein
MFWKMRGRVQYLYCPFFVPEGAKCFNRRYE